LPLELRPRPRRVVELLFVLPRRRPEVAVEVLPRFAALVVAVRRPPRRLLEFEPIEDWPRDEVPCRLRLPDFMRLVAIVASLSAPKWVCSLRVSCFRRAANDIWHRAA
jgi:hypothetical protein